jgi:endonuclease/exonuclease/phosphatase family metal-dependent hydrolase
LKDFGGEFGHESLDLIRKMRLVFVIQISRILRCIKLCCKYALVALKKPVETQEMREVQEVRFLTWNIQWGRAASGRVDLSQTGATLRTLNADVICLQEVAVHHPDLPGGGAAGDQPAEIAALLPGYAAIYGVGSDLPDDVGGRRQFGNLILSRLPVQQVFRHTLPWPADARVPSMPRVAVEAVVEVPWGSVRVVTTHLEYYSSMQRYAQVDALRHLHGDACAHATALRPDSGTHPPFAALVRPASAVFCGDFNFPPEAPDYAQMQAPIAAAPRLVDAWTLTHRGEPHAPSVGLHGAEWPDHAFCCDYFFVSEDLAPRLISAEVVAETAASDHQPVLITLR